MAPSPPACYPSIAVVAVSALQVDPRAAGERFGAFGAYYLPDGGEADFGDTVSVVNVLGNVLRRYLNADLPVEPEDLYLSVDRSPFDVRRVVSTWLEVGGTSANRTRTGQR